MGIYIPREDVEKASGIGLLCWGKVLFADG